MAKTSVALAAETPHKHFSITLKSFGVLLAAAIAVAAVPRANAQIAASILVDEGSGRVIRAHRADAPHAPASLTKMMTLYLTFEALEQGKITLGTRVPVSYHAAAQAPSKLYLQPGQEIIVEHLILAMAVKSANDAAAAMGEFLGGGSEYAFAERMTAKARELGMTSTTFRNASGLPAAGAYTTARDMATLARALHAKFPKYQHYFAKRYFQYGARTFRNTNRLLHTRHEVDGMKTGYTRASGFNLVATAEYRQQKIVLVVLGGRTSGLRYRAAEQLLAAAYHGLPARPPENSTVVARQDVAKDDDEDEGETAPAVTKKKPAFSLIPRAEASTRTPATTTPEAALTRFGIQIGNYRNYGQAQNAATQAYYKVPDAYRSGSTRVAVVQVKYGRRTQYAARVLGFNQSSAAQTCRALAKRGLPCRTLSYSLQSAALHSTSDVPDADDEDRAIKAQPKGKKALARKKRLSKRYMANR